MRKFLIGLTSVLFLSQPSEAYTSKPRGCPKAWCGCWLRNNVGHDPGVQYNLARNWVHWGRASSLQPGAVVVYPHHVVKVVSVLSNGRYVGISGNDSHQVKTRERSIRGNIGVRI